MALPPAKPCTYPGCHNFSINGGRCEEHRKKERADYDWRRDKFNPERKVIHSTRWRKVRLMKLNSNPLCERCLLKGIEEPATIVHHKDRNEFNWDWDNLESISHTCHELEHKNERFGRNR